MNLDELEKYVLDPHEHDAFVRRLLRMSPGQFAKVRMPLLDSLYRADPVITLQLARQTLALTSGAPPTDQLSPAYRLRQIGFEVIHYATEEIGKKSDIFDQSDFERFVEIAANFANCTCVPFATFAATGMKPPPTKYIDSSRQCKSVDEFRNRYSAPFRDSFPYSIIFNKIANERSVRSPEDFLFRAYVMSYYYWQGTGFVDEIPDLAAFYLLSLAYYADGHCRDYQFPDFVADALKIVTNKEVTERKETWSWEFKSCGHIYTYLYERPGDSPHYSMLFYRK